MKIHPAALKHAAGNFIRALKRINPRSFDHLLLGRSRKLLNKRFLIIILFLFSLSLTAGLLWGREITRKRTTEFIVQQQLRDARRMEEIKEKYSNYKIYNTKTR